MKIILNLSILFHFKYKLRLRVKNIIKIKLLQFCFESSWLNGQIYETKLGGEMFCRRRDKVTVANWLRQ